jgi:hypothetical protein
VSSRTEEFREFARERASPLHQSAYLLRILVNEVRDRWRRRERAVAVARFTAEPAVPDATDDLARRDRLLQALLELPLQQRATVEQASGQRARGGEGRDGRLRPAADRGGAEPGRLPHRDEAEQLGRRGPDQHVYRLDRSAHGQHVAAAGPRFGPAGLLGARLLRRPPGPALGSDPGQLRPPHLVDLEPACIRAHPGPGSAGAGRGELRLPDGDQADTQQRCCTGSRIRARPGAGRRN